MKKLFNLFLLVLIISFIGCFEDQEQNSEEGIYAQMSCSTNVSLVSNTETLVNFDTVDFDTSNLIDINSKSFVIKKDGTYLIIFDIEYSSDSAVIEAYTRLYKGNLIIKSYGGGSFDYIIYQANHSLLLYSLVEGDEFTLTSRVIGTNPLVGLKSTFSIFKI